MPRHAPRRLMPPLFVCFKKVRGQNYNLDFVSQIDRARTIQTAGLWKSGALRGEDSVLFLFQVEGFDTREEENTDVE